MWQIWLIICGICLVIEVMTHGFLVFWFALGALFAMITSFFVDSIIIQSTVFVLSSTLLIFATKPLVKKFINSKETVPTNAFSVVGKKGLVTEEINTHTGTGVVKIDGETWSAVDVNNSTIEKDSDIQVLEIKGVKLVVEKINVPSKSI